ncbi:HNH endonuclease [Alicyclobacillus suci]|uniref:HNH endonuclease n=1 Tax=Alicyclobacillus suci TaxID=2816080 RepID=UPI001A8C0EDD|nr:HNH endonuclease [Alicyclobacillus suci]
MKVNCAKCGQETEKVPSQFKKWDIHFCSAKCRQEYHTNSVHTECKNCGKYLVLNPYRVRENNFCSRECANEFQGEDNLYEIDGDITKIIITSRKYGIHTALIDTDELEKVKPFRWLLRPSGRYYYVISTRKNIQGHTQLQLHRLITDAPKYMHVDHMNGDPLDNRKCNLRVCTPQENGENKVHLNKNNKSGVRGVHQNKSGLWVGRVRVKGQTHYKSSRDKQEVIEFVTKKRAELMPFSTN